MKNILNKLLCLHDWKILKEIKADYKNDFKTNEFYIYILACKKCGKIEKVNTLL